MSENQSFPQSDLFSEQTELKRQLGLTEALSIVINRIIGSGIFRTPMPIMMLVASISLFYGVWIVGGIVTLFGAFCYAELVAMMPRSGGPYAYLKAAYPEVWTFIRGWAMFFVSETGAIAAVALVFAEYTNALYVIITGDQYSRGMEVTIALSVIWLLTSVNCFGIVLSGVLQNIFSFLKLFAVGAVIFTCFTKLGNLAHFTTNFWPEEFTWGTMLAFGAAMRYGFFAYSGWEGATYVAEEVRNPRKNLPLSIILGIAGIILLYLAANTAYLYQLPMEKVQTSKWVAVEAVKMAVGTAGGVMISIAVMLNTFGNVSAQILCKARTWYAMSRDGLFIGPLSKIHPKYKTPNTALLVQAAWASLLLMGAGFAEHAYETIIDFFSFTSSIFNVSTFAAIWILRRKYPDIHRPYKVWGYPFTLIFVLIIHLWFMVVTLITAFIPSLIGIVLTSTGLLYYYRSDIKAWFMQKF
ncbi:amino acid permease [candidate division KSB1 bacterium]|nr:amino acid permease [candidate division KSB1 bacterium]MBL7092801.1 amino acid permease [candidate division KSB1 bacterium]